MSNWRWGTERCQIKFTLQGKKDAGLGYARKMCPTTYAPGKLLGRDPRPYALGVVDIRTRELARDLVDCDYLKANWDKIFSKEAPSMCDVIQGILMTECSKSPWVMVENTAIIQRIGKWDPRPEGLAIAHAVKHVGDADQSHYMTMWARTNAPRKLTPRAFWDAWLVREPSNGRLNITRYPNLFFRPDGWQNRSAANWRTAMVNGSD
ncbi:hypothetical protein T492DRAFT_482400 [Pavlovales sp. CCMP2436]|nr:hypothetical protein T492DRAFT_482400 [Pavlovales sp. CCMP2436]